MWRTVRDPFHLRLCQFLVRHQWNHFIFKPFPQVPQKISLGRLSQTVQLIFELNWKSWNAILTTDVVYCMARLQTSNKILSGLWLGVGDYWRQNSMRYLIKGNYLSHISKHWGSFTKFRAPEIEDVCISVHFRVQNIRSCHYKCLNIRLFISALTISELFLSYFQTSQRQKYYFCVVKQFGNKSKIIQNYKKPGRMLKL